MDGAMNKVNGLENQLQKAEEVKQIPETTKTIFKRTTRKIWLWPNN
ncbi:MAG: hypothetical protein WDO19_21740 [Bacteroidota bacterium]